MRILCSFLGHKRVWPTLIDDPSISTSFMEYDQRNPDTGRLRRIQINPCERCGLLYWEPMKLPPKVPE